MSEESSSPAISEGEGTSNYTPKSYEIAAEDAALAHELTNQDFLRDLAGPATSSVALKFPDKVTRGMLNEAVLAQVDARLEALPANARAAAEQGIINEEARNYAYAVRVWGGPGPDANDYQQERFLIENEVFEAQSRLAERQSALAEIIRHDRKVDEATGETWDEPVYRVQGDARSAAEHEAAELRRRIALLRGSEGQNRLAKATWRAVENAKKLRDEVAIDNEAQALAAQEARAARVAEKAAAYRKFEDTER
ncbi:hypothetical protein P7228_11315 [Altererythrobacter arenosus]|uniref:KfrC n=1 Tax=Altererythrobacter arenosus TaxID=3032592 RepID=A0ABY8FNJ6_9SPHN|nr:hypothetical protein [Altererythrobacter sp. CAU 1644]WFL76583.1 hypothetical protein P7228_11315 [Altererythrobacter sp. CAU 1644]